MLRNLSKHNKQVVLLYCSSIIGIIMAMLVSILDTHNLSPSQYGDVRYISNYISLIAGFLLFGYFTSGSRLLAISTTEDDRRGINGAMCIVLGCTVLLSMFIMYICSLLHQKNNLSTLFICSIPVCSSAILLNYVNTAFQGENRIGSIAIMRLMPHLLYLVIAFYVYRYFKATPIKMILMQNGIAMAIGSVLVIRNRPSFKNIKYYLRLLYEENKEYGIHVYLGSISGVSLGYLAGITLGIFNESNNVLVGFFTLAMSFSMPLSMLPAIIGTTYFKDFAIQTRINKSIINASILLSVFSLFIFTISIYPIVYILYDESYSQVAFYAMLLSIGYVMHGFGDLFNRFLGAHGKGKFIRNAAFISGGILLVGNTVLVYLFDIYGAIGTRILASVGYVGSMLYYYRKYLDSNCLNDEK